MSKLTRAQSKTGKLEMVTEREINDKPEEYGLRVDRGADIIEKGRKVVKRKDIAPKRGKGPDRDSSKRRKRSKRD